MAETIAAILPPPRFQAEFMLRRNIAELDAYTAVFRNHILGAFPSPAAPDESSDPLAALSADLFADLWSAVKPVARAARKANASRKKSKSKRRSKRKSARDSGARGFSSGEEQLDTVILVVPCSST